MEIEKPAGKAIRLLGVKRIAFACDVTTDAVHKWGARNGLIPAPYQAAVFRLAKQQGVDLSAEDIIGCAA